jgi:hypothetical protein
MFTGKTPDITPAQIGAVLTFVVGQAVAFGWLDGTRAQTLVSAGSIIIAAAWKIADAYLRGSRAKGLVITPGVPKAAPTTLTTPTQV